MRRGGLFWGVARLREITRERELPEEQGKIELQGGKGNAPRYDFVDLFIYLFIYIFFIIISGYCFFGLDTRFLLEVFALVSVVLRSLLMPLLGFQAQRCLFWIVHFFCASFSVPVPFLSLSLETALWMRLHVCLMRYLL